MGYFFKNTSQGSRKLVWGMCHACFKSKLTKMSQGNPKYSEGRSKKDDKLRYGCKINVDGILHQFVWGHNGPLQNTINTFSF